MAVAILNKQVLYINYFIVGVDIDLARGTFHQTGSPRYGLLKLTLFWRFFLLRMRNDEVRSFDPCQQRMYKNRTVTPRSPLAKQTLSLFLMVGNTHTSFFIHVFLFLFCFVNLDKIAN